MEKISDLYIKTVVEDGDILSKTKIELSDSIDETIERGNVSSDVLIMMKDMIAGLKPVTSMEDYLDDLD